MKNSQDTVIVWGATSGVGSLLVERLCEAGTAVIAYARQPKELAELEKKHLSLTVRVFEDITESFYRQEAEKIREMDRHIIGMADCVGSITVRNEASLTDRLEDIMTPNLYHQYFSTQLFADLLADNASIVYVSSIRAKTGTDNANVEYAFAKAALENLARSFTRLLKARHIRVNAVRPTPILETKLSAKWPQEVVDSLTQKSIYGELLTPADIVPVIMFLLSKDSRAITGSVLDVTNGFEG